MILLSLRIPQSHKRVIVVFFDLENLIKSFFCLFDSVVLDKLIALLRQVGDFCGNRTFRNEVALSLRNLKFFKQFVAHCFPHFF